jgi:peptidoglycan LD-endopeptidase LytH
MLQSVNRQDRIHRIKPRSAFSLSQISSKHRAYCSLEMRAAVVVPIPIPIPPPALLSPFGSYPNVLELTDAHRRQFHPVLAFPEPPGVVDYTSHNAHAENQLLGSAVARMATREEWQGRSAARATGGEGDDAHPQELHAGRDSSSSSPPSPRNMPVPPSSSPPSSSPKSSAPIWTLGRYDEDRVGLYESDMFDDVSNVVNGFAGKRTVHVGIDLGGPVRTPVHSFWDGIVHSAGYNPDRGDYGHVVVVHYPQLPSKRHVYALYGHLDASIVRWKVGDPVARGQVVGGLGNVHENGGWLVPHVHFQLGMTEPETHDMAGAVSLNDRERALREHPDPRYVLGPLY